MAELRGAADEPGDGEPPVRRFSADAGRDGADAIRPRMEPRPRAEYAAVLLGEDGHKFCAGSQLEPVNGSMQVARANRDAWVEGDRSVPEPRVRPVETFEGGTVTFTFRPSMVGGYQVNTMYVSPPGNQAP